MTRSEAGKLGSLKLIENNISRYFSNPKKCKKCNIVLPYKQRHNVFCSHGCSASFNSLGRRDLTKNPWRKPCFGCGKETTNEKWCSHGCHRKFIQDKYIEDWLAGKPVKHPYNRVSQYVRRYLLSKGNICSICHQSVWMGKPIPLLTDHKNGNPMDDSPENIRLVCGNCDMQLPTYKGKNLGNGRFYRRKRYKEGKSY